MESYVFWQGCRLLLFLHVNVFSCSVIVCMAAVVIDCCRARALVGKMMQKKPSEEMIHILKAVGFNTLQFRMQ